MKLAELERQRIELAKQIKEETDRHNKSISDLKAKHQDVNRLIAASADGLMIDLISKAESVIKVDGLYEKAGADRAVVLQKAINDLAGGAVKLKKGYFGTKDYAHWHGQGVEHAYGWGPSHGSVIFSIGIRRDQLGRDLTEEEINASIYYLRNLSSIQLAATNSAV